MEPGKAAGIIGGNARLIDLTGRRKKSGGNLKTSGCRGVEMHNSKGETREEEAEHVCPGFSWQCVDGLATYECRPEPYDDPHNRFAKYKPVFCSGCARGRQLKAEWEAGEATTRRSHLLRQSNLPLAGLFENLTLESFALTANGTSEWFREVKGWVENWRPDSGKGLVLYGRCGVGKTGLLVTALKELINRHFASVFYITVSDFCDRIGAAWVERKGDEHNLMRVMREASVVFLDEVGTGHLKVNEMIDNTPLGTLFKVLDYRYRQGKPLVLATNCETPQELLEVLGERNFNRVYGICKSLLCDGKNLRGENN